jgi:hypothetical protein
VPELFTAAAADQLIQRQCLLLRAQAGEIPTEKNKYKLKSNADQLI